MTRRRPLWSALAFAAAASVLLGHPPPSALASAASSSYASKSPTLPPSAPRSLASSRALELRGGARRVPESCSAVVETEAVEVDLCDNVRRVLNGRLAAVQSGARGRDFARRYRRESDRIDGAYTIQSGHGRSGDDDDGNSGKGDDGKSGAKEEEGQLVVREDDEDGASEPALIAANGHGLFPNDLSSLELTLPPAAWAATAAAFAELREREEKLVNADKPPSFLALSVRACRLGITFAPAVWTAWLAAILPPFRRRIWFGLVGRSLAMSGPAFIKWGQWASTRADMFPDALCEALSQLHSDAPAHSWAFTEKTVEQSLCIPRGSLGEIFSSFEMEPVASGSIAQVHRAVLRADEEGLVSEDDDEEEEEKGTLVAVKVRHPRVSRLIDMDFRLMSIAADIVDHIPMMGWLRLRSSVEQFSHTMAAQAHLNVEAHHLEVLNHNFRNWKDVGFPKPIFSSAAVIMETFETGKVCTEVMDGYDKIASEMGGRGLEDVTVEEVDGSDSRKRKALDETYPGHRVMPVPMAKFVVGTGVSIYLKMLLLDNLMHADLHPGNLMLTVEETDDEEEADDESEEDSAAKSKTQRQKSRGYKGHITLVDAGMVAQLDESESVNFIGLLSSLGEGDGRSAAEAVLRFSSDDDGGSADDCGCDPLPATSGGLTAKQKEAFTKDMIALFDEKCGGYGTGVDVGEVLRGVLGLIRDHHVRIDANYATLVVNALCIESLANRVCPTYNVLDGSKSLLQSFRKICQSKDGKVALCHRSKFRKSLLQLGVPFLYLRKNLFDDNFFRRLELSRKIRSQPAVSSLFSSILGLAALVLSAKLAQDTDFLVLRDTRTLAGSSKTDAPTVKKGAEEDTSITGATRDTKSFLFGVFERWLRLDYQY